MLFVTNRVLLAKLHRIHQEIHHMDHTTQEVVALLGSFKTAVDSYIAARDTIDADLRAQLAAAQAKDDGITSADLNTIFDAASASLAGIALPTTPAPGGPVTSEVPAVDTPPA